MAKCKNCDYPYATGNVCPNCGSKNPSGKSTLNGAILIIVFVIVALGYCK
jgi:RNA polymerase subunit RPABC4/transcription elongation factor Spt4